MSRRGIAIVAVLLLAGLGAATIWPGREPASSSRRSVTIAWISKALGNPVFDPGHRAALQKAAELSARGAVDVRVIPMGPVSADAVEQVRVLDDVIASGVDGIAISCDDPTACIDSIDTAVAAGIPVLTWDSDAPDSRRFTYLGMDNYQAGRTAADMLVRAMGTEGAVAVLTGVPGGLNLEERVRGFRDRLAAYPRIRLVAVVYSNEDIGQGVHGVEEVMQAHPDLRGWFFAGMWPLFAERGSMRQWESATQAGKLQTIAFDTLPFQLDLLRDGYLAGLVGQKYWSWGADAVDILYNHLIAGKQYPSFVDSGFDIVTRKNVDAMMRTWETNDWTKPLPDPY